MPCYYDNYSEYLRCQQNFSQKKLASSKKIKRAFKKNKKNYLNFHTLVQKVCPEAKTLLLLGARSEFEVDFFRKLNYNTIGVDLFETKDKIIECDMSRLNECSILKGQTFDLMASFYSLEHCQDLDGLKKGLACKCKIGFYFRTVAGMPINSWDCARHPFMELDASPNSIEKTFTEFKLHTLSYSQKNDYYFFDCFLLRKRPTIFS